MASIQCPTPSYPQLECPIGVPNTTWNDFPDEQKANRFFNLDSIEDRIIYYLLSEDGKNDAQKYEVYNLRRCIVYPTSDALLQKAPTFKETIQYLSNGQSRQDGKRIFRSPYMDDAWKEECAMLKVYIDSVIPMNLYLSQVNIGIDCICHNKIINVTTPENDDSTFIAEVDGEQYRVETKSRISVMVKAVLSLLNNANIQGIGMMQFNYEKFMYNESRYALWNNRNFEGQKVVIGCQIGGVG